MVVSFARFERARDTNAGKLGQPLGRGTSRDRVFLY
jgi:hypothetical protein